MTPAQSYKKMWNSIEDELVSLSSDNYCQDLPGIRLFAAIIIQAGRDRDKNYFKSSLYTSDCDNLKIDSRFVSKVINNAFNTIKSGVVWEYVPIMEEEF